MNMKQFLASNSNQETVFLKTTLQVQQTLIGEIKVVSLKLRIKVLVDLAGHSQQPVPWRVPTVRLETPLFHSLNRSSSTAIEIMEMVMMVAMEVICSLL